MRTLLLQHSLKRETPNWHRAHRLNDECGWKNAARAAVDLQTIEEMEGCVLARVVRLPLVGTEQPAHHDQR